MTEGIYIISVSEVVESGFKMTQQIGSTVETERRRRYSTELVPKIHLRGPRIMSACSSSGSYEKDLAVSTDYKLNLS